LTTNNYTSYNVYLRHNAIDPYTHTSHKEKEDALQVVRDLKAKYGEPKVDLVESDEADVLHFSFKKTGLVGRVVLSKREVCERIHCPTCGNILRRKENEVTECHRWKCTWEFDGGSEIWRVCHMKREW
jgi:hypothetical protein